MLKSTLSKRGPGRMPRPEFPNRGCPRWKSACKPAVEKQLGSNHWLIVCGPEPLHNRSGFGLTDPVLEKSWAETTVSGNPDCAVTIPENDQPPTNAFTSRLEVPRTARPFP